MSTPAAADRLRRALVIADAVRATTDPEVRAIVWGKGAGTRTGAARAGGAARQAMNDDTTAIATWTAHDQGTDPGRVEDAPEYCADCHAMVDAAGWCQTRGCAGSFDVADREARRNSWGE